MEEESFINGPPNLQINEEQNFRFFEKMSTGNGKMFILKPKKIPSIRRFLTEKTPYQDILLPPISRLSRGNESQAIKFLPVCNSVKIIKSYCVPLHRAILFLICGLTVEILSFG